MPLAMGDGRPIFVEQPDAVRLNGVLTLISQPTLVWPGPELRADEEFVRDLLMPDPLPAGVVIDSMFQGTGIVPPPRGVTDMRQVRVLPASDGTAHAFRGSLLPDSSRTNPPVSSLWYARFDGQVWSAPEHVFAADRIYSGRTTVTVLDAHGSLHVAATAWDTSHSSTFRDGIQYARRASHGAWSSRWIDLGPHGGSVRYVALTASRTPGHLLLAFTGQVRTTPDHVGEHGLYIAHSVDGGLTWARPQLVRSLDTDSGWLLDAVQTSSGAIVLVWTTRTPASPGDPAMSQRAHFMVSSNGRSWQDLPELALPTAVSGRVPIAAAPDGFVVLADDGGTRRLHLWRWRFGATAMERAPISWSAPSVLALSRPAIYPTLSTTAPGEFHIDWMVMHPLTLPGDRSGLIPSSHFASYRICRAS